MKNKLKIVFFSFIFSFAFIDKISSQEKQKVTITCFVKDFQSGKFLGGSSIQIVELSKNGTTDDKGFYITSVEQGKYRVRVSNIGYEPFEQEVIANKNIVLDIQLKSREIYLKEIEISSEKKTIFKKNNLYDISGGPDAPNIDGVYALNLFNDNMSNEVWHDDKKCVNIKLEDSITFKGNGSLHIKWDKDGGGCSWVGMGFGWNAWVGKDLSTIVYKSAIQMYVRTKGDTVKGLPLAIALEDYSGVQTWTGFSSSFILGGKITSSWTKIIIPFNTFPMVRDGFDDSNVKQFMIQFFGDGDIYVDEVTIVPFEGNLKPTISVAQKTNEIKIDGEISATEEWGTSVATLSDKHDLFIRYDSDNLYFAASIQDDSPLINKQENSEIWNGDAIEIAIGTNPNADLNRSFYMMSDYQIGIKATENPYVWSWKKKEIMANAVVKTKKTERGYDIEIKIPMSELGSPKITAGNKLGFEIGIDNGDNSGARISQVRWSNPSAEGFHLNPSLWGLMNLK